MERGLVLVIPELAAVVDRWRLSTVPSAAAGGPAHVTALYPWVSAPTDAGDLARLREVLCCAGPMRLTFERLERFASGVLYLALTQESDRACRRLSETLTYAFPGCVPYSGEHLEPKPHLTVAMGTDRELDVIEAEADPILAPLLPATVMVQDVTVMEQRPGGRWRQAHHVNLSPPR